MISFLQVRKRASVVKKRRTLAFLHPQALLNLFLFKQCVGTVCPVEEHLDAPMSCYNRPIIFCDVACWALVLSHLQLPRLTCRWSGSSRLAFEGHFFRVKFISTDVRLLNALLIRWAGLKLISQIAPFIPSVSSSVLEEFSGVAFLSVPSWISSWWQNHTITNSLLFWRKVVQLSKYILLSSA